jgi:hypothetical protein
MGASLCCGAGPRGVSWRCRSASSPQMRAMSARSSAPSRMASCGDRRAATSRSCAASSTLRRACCRPTLTCGRQTRHSRGARGRDGSATLPTDGDDAAEPQCARQVLDVGAVDRNAGRVVARHCERRGSARFTATANSRRVVNSPEAFRVDSAASAIGAAVLGPARRVSVASAGTPASPPGAPRAGRRGPRWRRRRLGRGFLPGRSHAAGVGRASARRLDGNESEPTIHRVMVRAADVACRFAPMVRDVRHFVQMFAVPRPAAEASQGRGPLVWKLVSLSMDERCDAPPGPRREKPNGRDRGRSRPDSSWAGKAQRLSRLGHFSGAAHVASPPPLAAGAQG